MKFYYKEKYCSLKDEINLNKNYSLINKQCYFCNFFDHPFHFCPLITASKIKNHLMHELEYSKKLMKKCVNRKIKKHKRIILKDLDFKIMKNLRGVNLKNLEEETIFNENNNIPFVKTVEKKFFFDFEEKKKNNFYKREFKINNSDDFIRNSRIFNSLDELENSKKKRINLFNKLILSLDKKQFHNLNLEDNILFKNSDSSFNLENFYKKAYLDLDKKFSKYINSKIDKNDEFEIFDIVQNFKFFMTHNNICNIINRAKVEKVKKKLQNAIGSVVRFKKGAKFRKNIHTLKDLN